MKIGLFSLITYSFLDQRPQVMARKLASLGHEVKYFQPFLQFVFHDNHSEDDFEKYICECFQEQAIDEKLRVITMANVPAHNVIKNFSKKFNRTFKNKNIRCIKNQELDFAIICDPFWGEILSELGIPYIYDHLDDTHQMHGTVTNVWDKWQKFSMSNSIVNLLIQPNEAKREIGLYVPNGYDAASSFELSAKRECAFNIGCLSAIMDWFDYESVDKFAGSSLIIGPADENLLQPFIKKWQREGQQKFWIPRVERLKGMELLQHCKVLAIPFDDYHPVVDYVMPLKLVEYLSMGQPIVTYFNKAIELEFGDFVTFYSKCGLKNFGDLNEAYEEALNKKIDLEKQFQVQRKFTWDNAFFPLFELIGLIEASEFKSGKQIGTVTEQFMDSYRVKLISNGQLL